MSRTMNINPIFVQLANFYTHKHTNRQTDRHTPLSSVQVNKSPYLVPMTYSSQAKVIKEEVKKGGNWDGLRK